MQQFGRTADQEFGYIFHGHVYKDRDTVVTGHAIHYDEYNQANENQLEIGTHEVYST